jgi:hypothetical protein
MNRKNEEIRFKFNALTCSFEAYPRLEPLIKAVCTSWHSTEFEVDAQTPGGKKRLKN